MFYQKQKFSLHNSEASTCDWIDIYSWMMIDNCNIHNLENEEFIIFNSIENNLKTENKTIYHLA